MLVQKAGDLSSQRGGLQQAALGTGVIEELLKHCWDRGRLRCDVRPMRMPPLLPEEDIVIPIFVWTRTVYFFEIACYPFFVFGQREVALFELPKFADFGSHTSYFQQFSIFGRFRTILLCCGHKTSPYPARRELYRSPSHGRFGPDYKPVMSEYGDEELK